MKILVCGDPHFRPENAEEVNRFTEEFYKLLEEKGEEIDFVVILGDLLHTHERVFIQALRMAEKFISRITQSHDVYILVGNHDYINNQQFLTQNHWMNSFKEWDRVTIVDTFTTTGDSSIAFVPYVPNGRLEEALGDWNGDLLFAHQEFKGCSMNAITSNDGDEWDKSFVVSGHIHSRQFLRNNIYYPGSAFPHAFGESKNNVVAIVNTDEIPSAKSVKDIIEEIQLNVIKKRIIHTTVDNISEEMKIKKGEKVKVKISGTVSEFSSFKRTKQYKDIVKKGIKVVFTPPEPEPVTSTTAVSFSTVVSELLGVEKDREKLEKLYSSIVQSL